MTTSELRETNFDGLVGPTHNYGGLSPGNVASMSHRGDASSPKHAALQGLEKMRTVRDLGVSQAVLLPHERPHLGLLHRLGFRGHDEEVLAQAAQGDGYLLRMVSSAAAMWTANAATVAPACDTDDARTHFVPANLREMAHRSIEGEGTRDILRAIFSDDTRFCVHEPLPLGAHFNDEGAANHTRLETEDGKVHLYAFGRDGALAHDPAGPAKFPARQTRLASEAVARLCCVDLDDALFVRQDPAVIDAGAFHTDVVAVGSGPLLLLHEHAFADTNAVLTELQRRLGDAFRYVLAHDDELPIADAVAAYPFNSQLVKTPRGYEIIAPSDAEENPRTKAYLTRVVQEDVGVVAVHYLDVKQSMRNGGGPACLRLRVPLTDDDRQAMTARVFLDDALLNDLRTWVETHYRDKLLPDDLRDPQLWREQMAALDALTTLLRLPSDLYSFQRAGA